MTARQQTAVHVTREGVAGRADNAGTAHLSLPALGRSRPSSVSAVAGTLPQLQPQNVFAAKKQRLRRQKERSFVAVNTLFAATIFYFVVANHHSGVTKAILQRENCLPNRILKRQITTVYG